MHVVLGTCHHDCADSCGWEVTVDNGVATKMRGNPAHPYSQGELCPKVNRFLDRVNSPDRLLTPLIRVGTKGTGQFREASWDEAVGVIVERTRAAISQHGGETILPWVSAGNQGMLQMSSLDRRLFDSLGASQTFGSLCGSTAKSGFMAVTGSSLSTDPMTVEHAKLVLIWGSNTRLTNRHLWPFIEKARSRGAVIVVIDPIKTMTAEQADWFIQPNPGTDTALILAMLNVIIAENLFDADFVQRHVRGFEDLAAAAAEWSPERAAAETGLNADAIVRLARDYATTTPAFIRTLIGAEHRSHGGMLFSAMAALPSITGQWRHIGGGLSRSVHSWAKENLDGSIFDPVSPKPTRSLPFAQLGAVLNDSTLNPPVNVLFVWNGNPVITCPNSGATRKGLLREDLFTVVSEQFMTDTAKFADVVLPAAMQIEQVDVVASWGHLYAGWNGKAVEPRGESVSNTEMFRRLARGFGLGDPLFDVTDEELVARVVKGLDLKGLKSQGFARLTNARDDLFADGGFGHHDGKCDVTGISYTPVRSDDQHPLTLLTPKQHTRFINSSYSHLPGHGDREGGPTVDMHVDDAAARGISEGDAVLVFNQRGGLTLPVSLSGRLPRGVVSVPFGWWDAHHDGTKSVNDLTNDGATDMGGGVAYHDTFVQIAKA